MAVTKERGEFELLQCRLNWEGSTCRIYGLPGHGRETVVRAVVRAVVRTDHT